MDWLCFPKFSLSSCEYNRGISLNRIPTHNLMWAIRLRCNCMHTSHTLTLCVHSCCKKKCMTLLEYIHWASSSEKKTTFSNQSLHAIVLRQCVCVCAICGRLLTMTIVFIALFRTLIVDKYLTAVPRSVDSTHTLQPKPKVRLSTHCLLCTIQTKFCACAKKNRTRRHITHAHTLISNKHTLPGVFNYAELVAHTSHQHALTRANIT